MPNVARRLLESFLAFKVPNLKNESLNHTMNKLVNDKSEFGTEKTGRIERFLNYHSHRNRIDQQRHDNSILAKMPEIMKNVLEFIECVDKEHYDGMLKVVLKLKDLPKAA